MGKIFNIVGCSLALAGTFAANPVAHDFFRELVPTLVNALRSAPRRVKLKTLRHHRGHVYIFEMDEQLPDDRLSASTVILFENGSSIMRAPYRDVNRMIAEGGGATMQIGNKLLFSTPDNSSPITNGRNYFAIHSLTRDTAAFEKLAAWRRDSRSEGAQRLVEMLAMLCPRHFRYGALGSHGQAVEMRDVELALDHRGSMVMKAAAISVRPQADGGTFCQVSIRDIAPESDPHSRWSFYFTVDIAPEPAILLPALQISGPGGLELGYRIEWPDRLIAKAGKLRALRALMQPWFTDASGVEAWLGEMVDFLSIPLAGGGIGLTLDAASETALRTMLSDAAIDGRHEWTVTQEGETRRVTLGAAA